MNNLKKTEITDSHLHTALYSIMKKLNLDATRLVNMMRSFHTENDPTADSKIIGSRVNNDFTHINGPITWRRLMQFFRVIRAVSVDVHFKVNLSDGSYVTHDLNIDIQNERKNELVLLRNKKEGTKDEK